MTIIPAVPQVLQEFQISSGLQYSTLVVSIWELGEGIAPFVIAPLSEIYGRAVVYHIGNCLFFLCLIASALSTNISMLIGFRFLNGLTTTSLTLAPSIIGDLFVSEERGAAMATAIFFPLIGPFGAPIVGSYLANAKGWRWTIWAVAIAVGVLICGSLLAIQETYEPVILRRQSKARRSNAQVTSPPEISQTSQIPDRKLDTRSMLRPLRMLLFSPIILMISLYTALTYGIFYLIVTTLTEIFENLYGFSQGTVGLLFLGQGLLISSPASFLYLLTKCNSYRHDPGNHRIRCHVRSLLTVSV